MLGISSTPQCHSFYEFNYYFISWSRVITKDSTLLQLDVPGISVILTLFVCVACLGTDKLNRLRANHHALTWLSTLKGDTNAAVLISFGLLLSNSYSPNHLSALAALKVELSRWWKAVWKICDHVFSYHHTDVSAFVAYEALGHKMSVLTTSSLYEMETMWVLSPFTLWLLLTLLWIGRESKPRRCHLAARQHSQCNVPRVHWGIAAVTVSSFLITIKLCGLCFVMDSMICEK